MHEFEQVVVITKWRASNLNYTRFGQSTVSYGIVKMWCRKSKYEWWRNSGQKTVTTQETVKDEFCDVDTGMLAWKKISFRHLCGLY